MKKTSSEASTFQDALKTLLSVPKEGVAAEEKRLKAAKKARQPSTKQTNPRP